MILADHKWLHRIVDTACFLIYGLHFERFEREVRLNWATTALTLERCKHLKQWIYLSQNDSLILVDLF